MPLTKQQKEQQVAELTEKMKTATVGVLVDYCGLTVEEVTELRKKLRESKVDYRVYKNSVLRFASQNSGYGDMAKFYDGPNAIAISQDDAVAPAKILVEFAKTHPKIEIKAGFLDGKVATAKDIEALATLPSREEMLSKILGGFNAPVSGLANVLQATIRSVVYALSAYAEKKEA